MVHTRKDTWLIDCGAYRHMARYIDHLANIVQREFQERVILGDDSKYDVKGARDTSFQLDYCKTLQMRDVFLVPRMTSNLIAISSLEDEGYDVILFRGQVFIQNFGSSERIEIGICDGGLYRLLARLLKALLHDTVSSVELWHRRLAHLHHRALSSLRKVVTSLLEFEVHHDGVYQGCDLGKNVKNPFPNSGN